MMEAENLISGCIELLDAISIRIGHTLARTIYRIPYPSEIASSRLDIEQVIQYMNAHYPENLSINDLAKLIGRSPSAFRRVFKQKTGRSPIEFLIQIRLEKARKRLLATNEPITTIALACGFNSPSHFTASFLKKYAASPRSYQKLYRMEKSAIAIGEQSSPSLYFLSPKTRLADGL